MSQLIDSTQSSINTQTPPQYKSHTTYTTQTTPLHFNSSSTHTSSRQLDDWYLTIAVGGRRNFLFLEDNLTPAPYHIEQQPIPPQFDDLSAADNTQVIQIEGQLINNIEPLNLSNENNMDDIRTNNINQNDSLPSPSSHSLNQQLEQSTIGGNTVTNDQSAPSSPQSRGLSQTPPLTPIMRSQLQSQSTNNDIGRINNNSGGSAIESSPISDDRKSIDSTTQLQSLSLDSTNNSANNSRPQSASIPGPQHGTMTPRTKRRLSDVVCNSGLSVYLHAGFGQDSYFVACDANQQGKTAMVLGIADGVGGWRSSGIDSGIMSRAIMRTALNYVREGVAQGGIDTTSIQYQQNTPSHRHTYSNTASVNSQSMDLDDEPTHHRRVSDKQYDELTDYSYSAVLADPRELMAKAYYQVKAENNVPAGSTTACIVTLLPVYANQQQTQSSPNTSNNNNKVFPMFSDISGTQQSTSTTATQSQQSTPQKLGIPSNQDYVIMRTANLGDSGYIVVRFAKNGTGDDKNNLFPFRPHVVGFTPFQRDESNVVKQLAVIPESIASSNDYYEYCLTGDSVVSLSNGLGVRLDSIANMVVDGKQSQSAKSCDTRRVNILTYDDSVDKGGVVNGEIKSFVDNGVQACVELTLSDGRKLVCTPNHLIRTVTGWCRADQLVTVADKQRDSTLSSHKVLCGLEGVLDDPQVDGDNAFQFYLPCSKRTYTIREHRNAVLALARIIGHICSDGSTNSRGNEVKFALGHELDVAAVKADLVYFGRGDIAHKFYDRHSSEIDGSSFYQIVLDVEMSKDLIGCAGVILGKRPDNAILPAFVKDVNTPTSVVREFLAGFYGGGGGPPSPASGNAGGWNVLTLIASVESAIPKNTDIIDTESDTESDNDMVIESYATIGMQRYSSAENEADNDNGDKKISGAKLMLAEISQVLEQRFGVKCQSHIDAITQNINKIQYVLRMEPTSVLAFHEKIGFRYCVHKQIRMMAAASHFRDVMKCGNKSRNWSSKIGTDTYFSVGTDSKSSNDSSNNTDQTSQYHDVCAVSRERNSLPVIQVDVVWRRDAGMRQVYDVTVDKTSNFIANGIVVHNCDDKPEDATTSEHKLLDGDIIILASDGLWDNFDLESEHYINLPYGYNSYGSQSQQQNMMRMRVQQHINDHDRIRRQHQIIERIVMESLTNTPSTFVTARDSPRQESLNSRRRNSIDIINTVPEIDPAALCARLMQHSLEFQRKPDGKPDDLTIMVTQLRRRATSTA